MIGPQRLQVLHLHKATILQALLGILNGMHVGDRAAGQS